MILRPPSLDDVPALATLGRDSFCAAFEHLYNVQDLATFLEEVYAEDVVAKEVSDPRLVYQIAEDESGLLAYCKLGLSSSFLAHASTPDPLDLKQLYCRPGLPGRGIGAALMEWALAEARERSRKEILLSVYSENFGAQRFYQRYGFTKRADIGFWVGEQRDDEFLYGLLL